MTRASGPCRLRNSKGKSRSNAIMKAETKAKRRVTLSLVGLSTLDESEIESIPDAQPVPFDPAPLAKSLTPSPGPALLESAPDGGAGVGAPVVPADLNDSIPAAWKPFVEKSQMHGVIVALDAETRPGPRGDVTKTTVTLDTGECAATVDPAIAARGARVEASQRGDRDAAAQEADSTDRVDHRRRRRAAMKGAAFMRFLEPEPASHLKPCRIRLPWLKELELVADEAGAWALVGAFWQAPDECCRYLVAHPLAVGRVTRARAVCGSAAV